MKTLALIVALAMLVGCAPTCANFSTAIPETQAIGSRTESVQPRVTSTVAPTPTTTATPNYSNELKGRVRDFLTKGGQVLTLTNTSITYFAFAAAVGDAIGAYDHLETAWPPNGTGGSGLQDARLAATGWELASQLWHSKFNHEDEPTEPDINGYPEYLAYASGSLLIAVRDQGYIVEAYRGRGYLPFDQNIKVLFAKGNGYFEFAQVALLKILSS